MLYPTTRRAEQAVVAALANPDTQPGRASTATDGGAQASAHPQQSQVSQYMEEELDRAASNPGWTFMQVWSPVDFISCSDCADSTAQRRCCGSAVAQCYVMTTPHRMGPSSGLA